MVAPQCQLKKRIKNKNKTKKNQNKIIKEKQWTEKFDPVSNEGFPTRDSSQEAHFWLSKNSLVKAAL